MHTLLIMYITTPSDKIATHIATELLVKKLAACANTFPIKSTYLWNNAIQTGEEVVLLIKTFPHLFSIIKDEITALHPYETPLIAGFSAEVNEAYFSYVSSIIESQ